LNDNPEPNDLRRATPRQATTTQQDFTTFSTIAWHPLTLRNIDFHWPLNWINLRALITFMVILDFFLYLLWKILLIRIDFTARAEICWVFRHLQPPVYEAVLLLLCTRTTRISARQTDENLISDACRLNNAINSSARSNAVFSIFIFFGDWLISPTILPLILTHARQHDLQRLLPGCYTQYGSAITMNNFAHPVTYWQKSSSYCSC